jgi:hypothetical protein
MSLNKKKILYPVIAAMICSLTAILLNFNRTTSAYLTAGDSETNSLTTGENVIEIVETFTPSQATPELNTTKTYTKDVKVKNSASNGMTDCYVRVFLDFSDNTIRNASQVSADGTNYYSWSDFKSHLPSGWTYVSTGLLTDYFYYTQPLAPGESTPSLIKSVKTAYTTDATITDFDIYVYAESIQTKDIDGNVFTGTNPWQSAWTEYLS